MLRIITVTKDNMNNGVFWLNEGWEWGIIDVDRWDERLEVEPSGIEDQPVKIIPRNQVDVREVWLQPPRNPMGHTLRKYHIVFCRAN